jgi:hypothetical protein
VRPTSPKYEWQTCTDGKTHDGGRLGGRDRKYDVHWSQPRPKRGPLIEKHRCALPSPVDVALTTGRSISLLLVFPDVLLSSDVQ